MKTKELLATREVTHGRFGNVAAVATEIKRAYKIGVTYQQLLPYQREALDMIASKLARIVCGDSGFDDHWADVVGYAQLVRNEYNATTEYRGQRDE